MRSNLGLLYADKGDLAQAIEQNPVSYTHLAIQLTPDNAVPYYWRGLALREQGRRTEAIADLKKSLELTSNPLLREAAEQALSELGAQ